MCSDSAIDRHRKVMHTRKKQIMVIPLGNDRFLEALDVLYGAKDIMVWSWGRWDKGQLGQTPPGSNDASDDRFLRPHFHALDFHLRLIEVWQKWHTGKSCAVAVAFLYEPRRHHHLKHPHCDQILVSKSSKTRYSDIVLWRRELYTADVGDNHFDSPDDCWPDALSSTTE